LAWQVLPPVHAMSQPPQLKSLLVMSTQVPLQRCTFAPPPQSGAQLPL